MNQKKILSSLEFRCIWHINPKLPSACCPCLPFVQKGKDFKLSKGLFWPESRWKMQHAKQERNLGERRAFWAKICGAEWQRQDFHKYRQLQANNMAAQGLEECCCSYTGKNYQCSKHRDPGVGTAKIFNSLYTTTVTQLQPQQKQEQAFITPTIKFTFQARFQCQHIQIKSRENSLCCPNSLLVPSCTAVISGQRCKLSTV